MGDPLVYQGKPVGYVGGMNTGKPNQGFLIRFNNLDTLVRILSLPDSEILHIGRTIPEDEVSVGKFKKEYIEDNCVAFYFSREQEARYKGELLTKQGVDIANHVLKEAGFPPLMG